MQRRHGVTRPAADARFIDPVCGMTVTADHRITQATRATTTGSARRAAARSSSPIRRATSRRPPATPKESPRRHDSTRARCTRRSSATSPGTCPICGMALEPVMPSLDDGENPGADATSAPLLVDAAAVARRAGAGDVRASRERRVARGSHAGSSSCWRRRWCCGPAGRSSSAGRSRSRNRSPNMWTLIGTGVGAAFVYSVVATLAPGLFPGVVPRARARRRSTSRPPRSSSR